MTEGFHYDIETKLMAGRVQGSIQGIDRGISSFQTFDPNTKEKIGKVLAEQVLNDLPSQVCEYIHSVDLPEIHAKRDTGLGVWDREKAIVWSNEILGH